MAYKSVEINLKDIRYVEQDERHLKVAYRDGVTLDIHFKTIRAAHEAFMDNSFVFEQGTSEVLSFVDIVSITPSTNQ